MSGGREIAKNNFVLLLVLFLLFIMYIKYLYDFRKQQKKN